MDDRIVILAAVGGGLTGLLLLLHAGRASRREERAADEEEAIEPTAGHVMAHAATPRPRASSAPILTALGVAVSAVGLLVGGGGAGLGPLALLPGAALLITALVVVARQS